MMYYRISKNEKNLFFGKKNRPGVGSDLKKVLLSESRLSKIDFELRIFHGSYISHTMTGSTFLG